MGRNTRKRRSSMATKAVAASAALALGGGGLIWANFYASAHESNSSGQNETKAANAAVQVATISCPDVGQKLTSVPNGAKQGVATELANLDKQITEAYARLASTRQAQAGDSGFVQNAIVGPLKEKRAATIDRIRINIQRSGGQFDNSLSQLAACTTQAANNTTAGQQNGGQQQGGQQQNGGQQQRRSAAERRPAEQRWPAAERRPEQRRPAAGRPAAGRQRRSGRQRPRRLGLRRHHEGPGERQGQARQERPGLQRHVHPSCGVNANKNFNTDNVIVAPGVTNGAHHMHDYVGNQKINAFSNNNTLLAAGTSCANKGDLSPYYWPVLRLQDGTQEFDQNQDGGGKEGNVGKILTAQQAADQVRRQPQASKVVAMPQFLRIITGDAKTTTNGLANANAHWSCTGFENKVQLTEQYPICPQGSNVVRTFAFQSCWDGKNIDSANHRSHVAFADAERQLPERLQGDPAADDAPHLQRARAGHPERPGEERLRGRRLPGAAAQAGHRPRRLHQRSSKNSLANKIANCVNSGQRCQ